MKQRSLTVTINGSQIGFEQSKSISKFFLAEYEAGSRGSAGDNLLFLNVKTDGAYKGMIVGIRDLPAVRKRLLSECGSGPAPQATAVGTEWLPDLQTLSANLNNRGFDCGPMNGSDTSFQCNATEYYQNNVLANFVHVQFGPTDGTGSFVNMTVNVDTKNRGSELAWTWLAEAMAEFGIPENEMLKCIAVGKEHGTYSVQSNFQTASGRGASCRGSYSGIRGLDLSVSIG